MRRMPRRTRDQGSKSGNKRKIDEKRHKGNWKARPTRRRRGESFISKSESGVVSMERAALDQKQRRCLDDKARGWRNIAFTSSKNLRTKARFESRPANYITLSVGR